MSAGALDFSAEIGDDDKHLYRSSREEADDKTAMKTAKQATIESLSWMTGSWIGPTPTHMLEENWTPANNGAIAGVMRFITAGSVDVFELILIEEEADTLIFRGNQWFSGFDPKLDQLDVMKLSSLTDNSVTFEEHGFSRMKRLTYSRPQPDLFKIEISVPDRELIVMELEPVKGANL